MKYRKIMLTAAILLITLAVGTIQAQDAGRKFTIGYASIFSIDAFKAEMTTLGYTEGENITYLAPSFEGIAFEDYMASYTTQLQQIIDAKPDIFVVNTDTDAVNLKAMVGDTVPIVFARADDPVATGAVADLIKPGGNITGVMTNRPHERRLQILTEIKPSTKKVLYLYSTQTGEAETVLHQVEAVAEKLNVEIVPAPITDLQSALDDLKNIPDDVDWLFTTPYVPFDASFTDELTSQSVAHKAGISGVIDTPIKGYVVGYGPNIAASDGQAAQVVDRILRGASPAELPVETAENYLSINLEAAQAISLDIPEGILRQAEIIARPGYFDNQTNPFGGS